MACGYGIYILKTGGYEQQENKYPSTFPATTTTTTFNPTKYQTQNNSLASATDITEMYTDRCVLYRMRERVSALARERMCVFVCAAAAAEQQLCETVLCMRVSNKKATKRTNERRINTPLPHRSSRIHQKAILHTRIYVCIDIRRSMYIYVAGANTTLHVSSEWQTRHSM